jgi:hypothetical protein
LHGHDYERRVTLDVLTGAVYDAVTRRQFSTLKSKALEKVRNDLRRSKDFAERVKTLLG